MAGTILTSLIGPLIHTQDKYKVLDWQAIVGLNGEENS